MIFKMIISENHLSTEIKSLHKQSAKEIIKIPISDVTHSGAENKRSYKTVLISFILHSQVLHRITGKIYNGCQAHVITARLDRQRRRFMQHSSVLDS